MRIRDMTRDFAAPDDRLGLLHLTISLAMYAAAVVIGTVFWGVWPVVGLAVLTFTGASIRLFGIQHDCGHLSYFASKQVNVVTGVLLGAFTHNAYFAMRYNHNRHHAFIGNLDRMEAHEVLTWTVAQYRDASFWRKVYYRIYRSAPVIFVIGPLFIIFLRYRFPKNALKTGLGDVLIQNALMVGLWCSVWLIGGGTALMFFVTAAVVTACLGVFMVYVGHNHEDTYWEHDEKCDFEEASLKGASVLDLGRLFDFMTFNFAYHDLHHLNARIPAYHLKVAHVALTDVLTPTRLGWWQALQCIRWKLWDEDQGRMVTFRQAGTPTQMHPAE